MPVHEICPIAEARLQPERCTCKMTGSAVCIAISEKIKPASLDSVARGVAGYIRNGNAKYATWRDWTVVGGMTIEIVSG